MKLYKELSKWYRLITPLEDYKEEAKIIKNIILENNSKAKTILEFGCGAGHNAFYLKKDFVMTLTDISQDMLNLSKEINPDCEHFLGDMKKINLKQQYDVVFVHDAISYINNIKDLEKVIKNASKHCNKGGLLILCPDHFKDTFKANTSCGGVDNENVGLRYLQWENLLNQNQYVADLAFILRDEEGKIKVESDHHIMGLFSKIEWQKLLEQNGFNSFIKEHLVNETEHFSIIIGIRRYA